MEDTALAKAPSRPPNNPLPPGVLDSVLPATLHPDNPVIRPTRLLRGAFRPGVAPDMLRGIPVMALYAAMRDGLVPAEPVIQEERRILFPVGRGQPACPERCHARRAAGLDPKDAATATGLLEGLLARALMVSESSLKEEDPWQRTPPGARRRTAGKHPENAHCRRIVTDGPIALYPRDRANGESTEDVRGQ